MDEYIRKIVAEAPPLSDEQNSKIAGLFDVERQRAQGRAERRPYTGGVLDGLKRREHLPGKPRQSNEEVLPLVTADCGVGAITSLPFAAN